ncbi:hypothetical protein F511_46520 [Dorcoceras hygrometricum]|uniref:Uncharacterized protein n=1 Tax=Dorcoceras hygrometricum TaxID=472368 RepID=A0A2Z6ZTB6_9LAMI|nr:hypothetical protein F511_46520 [Dorcoceras hygrometricum]
MKSALSMNNMQVCQLSVENKIWTVWSAQIWKIQHDLNEQFRFRWSNEVNSDMDYEIGSQHKTVLKERTYRKLNISFGKETVHEP